MTNDDKDVTAFMKNASLSEILKNKELWGEDLSYLERGLKKYVD